MTSQIPDGGRLRLMALAFGLGVGVFSVSSGMAGDGEAPIVGPRPKGLKSGKVYPKHPGPGCGTLGYGKPGLYPGFQGFGLGYHPGYGYGGAGLGVGVEGGYPFYGGPGYPHPWPVLRRIGGITPFPFFGGPGYPTPDHPNYFGGVGPLTPDQPVVTIENDPGYPYSGGYGDFTGSVPDAESRFAPYETIAATAGSSSGVSGAAPANPAYTTPGVDDVPGPLSLGRTIGIETEPVVSVGGARGLKINRVYPGSPAEKAGLHAGDTIESINGYLTELPINLVWIVTNAAPDKVLQMSVRTTSDGEVRKITVKLL